MKNKSSEQKLKTLLSENPDPSKWSKWLKVLIAILSAILGALAEDATNLLSVF